MSNLDDFEAMTAGMWRDAFARSRIMTFFDVAASRDRRLFAIYMIQVYHYASHTARNQALVGANPSNRDVRYMEFCFHHALEETGHELMALHDLESIGVDFRGRSIPDPLEPTELLIAYLYYVSQHGNPVGRLGYSYWSESSYRHIAAFMERLTAGMQLKGSQLTFFHSHSSLDEKHAREVADAMREACRNDDDWQAVRKVGRTTLRLTHGIVEASLDEFGRLDRGEPSPYSFLNALPLGG